MQNNARVNLVQHSFASQQQSEEKMNLANPPNVDKKKPKNRPKRKPEQGGRNHQQPPWALGIKTNDQPTITHRNKVRTQIY